MNAAFAEVGLDWTFLAFEVAPDRGAAAVEAVRTLGLGGLTVTMPHKAAASAAVDERTPAAAALDAVNCVSWEGDRLVGDNTDGIGFVDALRVDLGVEVAGMRCVVVGAGGAGRAVVRALATSGAAEVVVVNRSLPNAERAVAVAGEVGRLGEPDEIAHANLVVNATPVGMGSDVGLPLDPDLLHPGQVVADLVYYPLTTPLVAEAQVRGALSVNGLGMLIHQAGHAFRRWTDHHAPLDVMAAAARSELDRRVQEDLPTAADSTGIHPTVQPDGKDS